MLERMPANQVARLLTADGVPSPDAGRIREVREGPDGLLYVLTDSPQGRLLRLLPQ
jgi:glucose/arabinose dehydrogenase